MSEATKGKYWPATGRMLRNLADGFNRNGKSQSDAAAAIGLADHTTVNRMLHGKVPVPLHYLAAWREWLGAPGYWPMQSWDEAQEMVDRGHVRDTESGPFPSHRGPGSGPRGRKHPR